MKRIAGGLALIAVSVGLAILAIGGWLGLSQASPLQGWAVFGAGLFASTAAALAGVWVLLGVFRESHKEEEWPSSKSEE